MSKIELYAVVSRGANAGELLFPHKHEDGCYVVSKSRFEGDYMRLSNLEEVLSWLDKGYGLRMSNPEKSIKASSLIMPGSITRRILS